MAEPDRAVAMVSQRIAGIGVQEHIQCAVIEREPRHDLGEMGRRDRDLIAPKRMGADWSLVKASDLHETAQPRRHLFAKR